MTARHRWALVAALVAVLVAIPVVISVLPVTDTDVSAEELLSDIQDSGDVSYSGYAQSIGGVLLPINEQLPELVELFADRTTTRVWWRDAEEWRVDTIGMATRTARNAATIDQRWRAVTIAPSGEELQAPPVRSLRAQPLPHRTSAQVKAG